MKRPGEIKLLLTLVVRQQGQQAVAGVGVVSRLGIPRVGLLKKSPPPHTHTQLDWPEVLDKL